MSFIKTTAAVKGLVAWTVLAQACAPGLSDQPGTDADSALGFFALSIMEGITLCAGPPGTSVSGYVSDAADQAPIASTAIVLGEDCRVLTDSMGGFAVLRVPSGVEFVRAQKISHCPVTFSRPCPSR